MSDKTEGQIVRRRSDGPLSFSQSAQPGNPQGSVVKWWVCQGLGSIMPQNKHKTGGKSYWNQLGQSNHPQYGKHQTTGPTKIHSIRDTIRKLFLQCTKKITTLGQGGAITRATGFLWPHGLIKPLI